MTVNFKCKIGAYSIMLKFWVPCSVESILSMKPVKAGEQRMPGPLPRLRENSLLANFSLVEGTSYVCSISVPCDPLSQPNGMQYHPRQKEGIQSSETRSLLQVFPEPSRRIGLTPVQLLMKRFGLR